jgi:hypothetical protein
VRDDPGVSGGGLRQGVIAAPDPEYEGAGAGEGTGGGTADARSGAGDDDDLAAEIFMKVDSHALAFVRYRLNPAGAMPAVPEELRTPGRACTGKRRSPTVTSYDKTVQRPVTALAARGRSRWPSPLDPTRGRTAPVVPVTKKLIVWSLLADRAVDRPDGQKPGVHAPVHAIPGRSWRGP